jgi:hypothetical protein
MSTAFYEIVLLPDGDFALQRTDEDAEPLVRIRFSDEAKEFLGDTGLDIAQVMIDAGIEAVELLGVGTDNPSDAEQEQEMQPRRILH